MRLPGRGIEHPSLQHEVCTGGVDAQGYDTVVAAQGKVVELDGAKIYQIQLHDCPIIGNILWGTGAAMLEAKDRLLKLRR